MEAEGESSTRFCAGQVEAVHNLECREARKKTVSFSESRTPSKGIYNKCQVYTLIIAECRPPYVSKQLLVSISSWWYRTSFSRNCRS